MALQAGQTVLRGRYRLMEAPLVSDEVSASWIGVGIYGTKHLVKLWPFEGDTPDEFKRALWDAELRTMYRVGSSPGAEDTTLVIRDAGLDRDSHCFVMVMEAIGGNGYTPLSHAMQQRGQFNWLSNQDSEARQELWRGLQLIAEGLQLLHDQHVLHRNLGIEALFLNLDMGPRSFRLGGFEWSIRVGQPTSGAPIAGWATPPEFFADTASGFRQETDWYAFGVLIARCLLSLESLNQFVPVDRHARIVREIEKATARQLSALERAFLLRLIDAEPNNRLAHGHEICSTIKEILVGLERGVDTGADNRPLVVAIDPASNRDLIERAHQLGFVPNPASPTDVFNPGNLTHITNLTSFLQHDLALARLYAVPKQSFYLLAGENFTLILVPFEHSDQVTNRLTSSWGLAFCNGIGQLRGNEGGFACRDLAGRTTIVRTVRQIYQERQLRQTAQSWERFLPSIDRTAELRSTLARFHEFIRCTNQLELLIRDAELFRYQIVGKENSVAGRQGILIREIARDRLTAQWCSIEGGLPEYLQREIDSGKADCRLVLLTHPGEDGLTINREVPREDFWEVRKINDDGSIILDRSSVGRSLPLPPQIGTIRTFGMFGQVSLIRRRKRAIDRLEKHSYLLRSLSAPGQVFMDTGEMPLPVPVATGTVDEAKQAVMQDILRVRPIYSLQGPPGTGKTTLVSHLVRQILADDPVAQILITAQAHGAVDVLRAKVRDESFRDIDQPLAVRLGSGEDFSNNAEGSVPEVSLRVLKAAHKQLTQGIDLTPLRQEWLQAVTSMIEEIESTPNQSGARDFCELVRRGASLAYCTTSAGHLEELAEGAQSFDWSIVEEAGKAHGFDLALPLQAGHRWLLIGDPNQLPPYRFEAYQGGIEQLDEAVALLEKLPTESRNLLDFDWVRSWHERSDESRVHAAERIRSSRQVLSPLLLRERRNAKYSRSRSSSSGVKSALAKVAARPCRAGDPPRNAFSKDEFGVK